MGWKIPGSNPGRKKRLSLLHTCPEAKSAMGTWALCQAVKRPRRGVGYRPPSTVELNNDWSDTSTTSSLSAWHMTGRPLP